MLLVVSDIRVLEKAALQYVVELKQCSYLVATYLAKVVGTLTTNG
jgi:hypothetical protein